MADQAEEVEGQEADDTTPAEQPAEAADKQSEAAPEKTEAKARRMGWKPEDEYEGPKDKWVDASTFVKRGEEEAPLQKATIRRLESEVKDLRKTLKEFGEHHSKRVKAEYARAVRDIEARIAEDTEAGNVEGVLASSREMAELKTEMEAGEKPDGPSAEGEKAFESFKEDNAWFDTDDAMTGAAHRFSAKLNKPGKFDPSKDPEAHFAEVTRLVREAFPHKFGNARRKDAAAVEGAPGRGNGRAAKTFNDLPADAKATCNRFVEGGVLTKEQYVKDYFIEESAR